MREIGSEFWSIPTIDKKNSIFPEETKWFVSGRSALTAIIRDIQSTNPIASVALPDWCCETMIMPFLKAGIEVEFYQALVPIVNVKADALLVMDYFGYTGHSKVDDFDGIVIRDITHSIFSNVYNDADYYYGSLRKWAGFWTGGFAWGFKNEVKYDADQKNFEEYCELRQSAMDQKKLYITDSLNGAGGNVGRKKVFLNTYELAEGQLDYFGVLPADNRDIELAKYLDIEKIKQIRRHNASILLKEFPDRAIFPEINEDDCPLFVPIRVENRDKLRNHLINNEIYLPVHWPSFLQNHVSDQTKQLQEEELSLVCDQRYGEKDMIIIIECIREFERNS